MGLYSRVADLDVPFHGHCEDSAVSQVLVCPVFMDQLLCTVLVNCRWSREVRSKRFRTRQTAVTSGRVFSSLAVPVCPGAAGRRISLARGADDPGSLAGPRPGTGGRKEGGRHGGACGCGDPSAKGMPLGLGAATAPLDGTDCAPIPLCGKGGGAHTHTPVHRERAAPTSTYHPRHALTSGARAGGVVLCVGV